MAFCVPAIRAKQSWNNNFNVNVPTTSWSYHEDTPQNVYILLSIWGYYVKKGAKSRPDGKLYTKG